MKTPLLEIRHISVSFEGFLALKDLNLSLNQGDLRAVIGPNGAGKTTTFYIMVGLLKADSENIFLDKTDISNMPIYIRGQKGISYLPQEPSIFRGMNVEDNLMAIIEIIEKEKPDGVVVQYGGQTPLKLANQLKANKVTIIGTSPESIDIAENREKFKKCMDEINIETARGGFAKSMDEAEKIIEDIPFPIIIRPSFTMGGTGGSVAYNIEEFNKLVSDFLLR